MPRSLLVSSLLAVTALANSYPPDADAYLDWDIRVDSLSTRGDAKFEQLFEDPEKLKIEVLATIPSTWLESPHYISSLNSFLLSSPGSANLYRYDMSKEETSIFLEDAGELGGNYDRDIPRDECLECGPNGLMDGLDGMDGKVIMNQLALGRVIAFDPSDTSNNTEVDVIADNYDDTELNSPNDLALSHDRKSIYFTDPTFGLQQQGDTGFLNSFNRSKLGFQGVYRVDSDDLNNAILVVDNMDGPNGLAATKDGEYLIVSNTGSLDGWQLFWNRYKITDSGKYTFVDSIGFDMGALAFNSWTVPVPLADGMEVYDDGLLLATCPNGICLIDLNDFGIIGRISIDLLVSNIQIYDGWLYITGDGQFFRIGLDGNGIDTDDYDYSSANSYHCSIILFLHTLFCVCFVF